MHNIKAALQGKTLLPNGIVDHDSVALTPHLKLFVVTYPQDIKNSLPNCTLFDGIVDGLSLWVGGNVSEQVRTARDAVGKHLPVITGAYIYNSGAKWNINPDIFYELLNQSIDLYDRAEIEGFFLFAGSVLEQMNSTMWERWDIPSHLDDNYFPFLGTATVTVEDRSTRKPVPNATAVVLYNGVAGQVHVTRKVTNELGHFSFGGWAGQAEPSFHTATVLVEGYETLSARVEVQARKTVPTTLMLVRRPEIWGDPLKTDDKTALPSPSLDPLAAPANFTTINSGGEVGIKTTSSSQILPRECCQPMREARLKVDDDDAAQASPMLFIDTSVLASHTGLKLSVHKPVRGPRVLWPTEPWESWAIFGGGSVVQTFEGDANYSAATAMRMYYSCSERGEKNGTATLGQRRGCVAVSRDGVSWSKPKLDIFFIRGQPSNIFSDCQGTSVFIDRAPHVLDGQRWKMICNKTVWAGSDGWHFQPMFGAEQQSIHHKDDTEDTGYWDAKLGKYVIMVRRDVQVVGKSSGVIRQIGRCVTDDLSDWEKFAPADGCEIVFGPDEMDPDDVDVYTNAWTRYAGVELFFPTMYHHFTAENRCCGHIHRPGCLNKGDLCSAAPNDRDNDGLLNIRLVVSRDAHDLSYVDAEDGRRPIVELGINNCGPNAVHPTVHDGWCDMQDGVLATTAFDTSGGYMVAGSVISLDEEHVYTYASGQPFSHDGFQDVTWGNNTGIQLLHSRKHGFVSIDAPYIFNQPIDSMPQLATKPMRVPTTSGEPFLVLNIRTSNVGFALIELRDPTSGAPLPGFMFNESDLIRGNTLSAAASWNHGEVSSLAAMQRDMVTVAVAMADTELFSLHLGELTKKTLATGITPLKTDDTQGLPKAAAARRRVNLESRLPGNYPEMPGLAFYGCPTAWSVNESLPAKQALLRGINACAEEMYPSAKTDDIDAAVKQTATLDYCSPANGHCNESTGVHANIASSSDWPVPNVFNSVIVWRLYDAAYGVLGDPAANGLDSRAKDYPFIRYVNLFTATGAATCRWEFTSGAACIRAAI
jgi:hypothetical protein